jgi:2,4-dienoyl-CoA reductase-like NADH-dependent reductase (Old Yellow Enzyme family)
MSLPINTPLTLRCGLTLPNRIAKAAMTEGLADDNSSPSPELLRLYEEWSAGGSGLLITGNVQVDRRYLERPGNVAIDGPQSEAQLHALSAMAQAAKKHCGCKCIVQLGHAGRQTNAMTNLSPVGPGNVPMTRPHGLPSLLAKGFFGPPRALTATEIEDVVRRFASAAIVCKEAGFDGVQVHAAHGYLISSFLNPNANNRPELFGAADAYGGTLACRTRVLLDAIGAIRTALGSSAAGFAICVKLNSSDFQKGGLTTAEVVQLATWLEEAGVDLLEISGGNYETGIYRETVERAEAEAEVGSADSVGLGSSTAAQATSTATREAYFLRYAVQVQAALTTLPLMVTGGWRTAECMNAAVASGQCAVIGIGRPLCADPAASAKLLSGELSVLPCYEDTLSIGYRCLRPLFLLLPESLRKVLRLGSLQGWYYRNIVAIATTGKADLGLGPFRCFLSNMRHEMRLAQSMRGVETVGTARR